MKFMLFVLPTVPGTAGRSQAAPAHRAKQRAIPADAGRVAQLAVFADDAGFDVFATTEHHCPLGRLRDLGRSPAHLRRGRDVRPIELFAKHVIPEFR